MSDVILHNGVHYNHGLYGYVLIFFMNMTITEFILYVSVMSIFGYYISKKSKLKKESGNDKF